MEAKDLKFDTSPGKVIKTLSQKQNMKKRGWGYGSSGRSLAEHAKVLGPNPQYQNNKKIG
jgi:hypothetical protein